MNKIKWRAQDELKVIRLIERFNSKVNLVSAGLPRSAVPELINYEQAKEYIQTRSDFNRYVNKHERFLRAGAERLVVNANGVEETLWGMKNLYYGTQTMNRARAREKKRLIESGSNLVGSKSYMNLLEPFQFNFDKYNKQTWNRLAKKVALGTHSSSTENKAENYKKNYIKAVTDTFEQYADAVLSVVNTVPAVTLASLIYEDDNMQIIFIYDAASLYEKAATIIAILNSYGYYGSVELEEQYEE